MSRKSYVIPIICAVLVTVIALGAGAVLLSQYQSAKMEYSQQLSALNKTLASQQQAISEKAEQISTGEASIADFSAQLATAKAQLSSAQAVIGSYEKAAQEAMEKEISGKRMCYLTFDDGPSENTLKVLKILDKYKVKATFFVTALDRTEYIKNIADAGHSIGLHTYSHDYSKIYTSCDAYFKDLNKISALVEEKCGVVSKIIRFPGGSSNTVSRSYCSGIMSKLTREVQSRGYAYFDWNADSGDASGNNIPASKLLSNVKADAKGMKSITILMHDTAAKDTTVEALPSIIEHLKSEGFEFAGLTTSSPAVHHGVNN